MRYPEAAPRFLLLSIAFKTRPILSRRGKSTNRQSRRHSVGRCRVDLPLCRLEFRHGPKAALAPCQRSKSGMRRTSLKAPSLSGSSEAGHLPDGRPSRKLYGRAARTARRVACAILAFVSPSRVRSSARTSLLPSRIVVVIVAT